MVLYTTDPCGYCHRAKALLEARGILFREVRLPRTAEGRARLAEAVHKGWALGDPAFLDRLRELIDRPLQPRRRGRPARPLV